MIGSGPAAPQPDSPGSGILVRSGGATLLLDCGPGTIGMLSRTMDPRTLAGVVISHFHADHYLDLVALRYLLPWAGMERPILPVYVPPGGRRRLEALAIVIEERRSFFEDAMVVEEYAAEREFEAGPFRVRVVPSRHYIPAWSIEVSDAAGHRVFYTGDTGPNPALAEVARGADLLIIEATLARAEDDVVDRGHLSLDEAIDTAREAGVPRVIVTHFPGQRRDEIRARANGSGHGPRLFAARPGLRVTLGVPDSRRPSRRAVAGDGSAPSGEAGSRDAGDEIGRAGVETTATRGRKAAS